VFSAGKRTSIAEGIHLRIDRVGQTALFADGLKEPRAHAAAQDRVQQVNDEAVGVRDFQRRNGEAELHLLQRLFVLERDVREGLRLAVAGELFAGRR